MRGLLNELAALNEVFKPADLVVEKEEDASKPESGAGSSGQGGGNDSAVNQGFDKSRNAQEFYDNIEGLTVNTVLT